MSGYLRTPTVFHRVSPKCFSVQKYGKRGWVARCCLLQCEGCCWIGFKPRFTLGPCQGTLRMQLCMSTLLFFHIWMLLKLVSGSCLNFAVYSSDMLPGSMHPSQIGFWLQNFFCLLKFVASHITYWPTIVHNYIKSLFHSWFNGTHGDVGGPIRLRCISDIIHGNNGNQERWVIEATRRRLGYAGLKPNHKKAVKEYGELLGCVCEFCQPAMEDWMPVRLLPS